MPRLFRRARYSEAGKRREGGLPFHRRHRKAISRSLTALILVGLVGMGYAYNLNKKFQNIDRVKLALKEKDRPDPDKGKALNIMLLGSDKGKADRPEWRGKSLADDVKSGNWPNGKYRSDTIMIVHISANRKHVYLVSIPRDSFVTLYDESGAPQGKEKINSAFSYFGPIGAISTVEHLTDLRMKHLAIIDWDGFKALSTAVGGVPVCIPKAVYDEKQKKNWTAGNHLLKGKEALQYVRQRYGLVRGDFDRIDRQQNFLRSLMTKILEAGTLRNPIKLNNTLEALTRNLTVDSAWTPGDMRGLALSLRGTAAADVEFMTVPVAGTSIEPTHGDVVNIDEARSQELFEALRGDSVHRYLKKYPDDKLKTDKNDKKPSATETAPEAKDPKPNGPCKSSVS